MSANTDRSVTCLCLCWVLTLYGTTLANSESTQPTSDANSVNRPVTVISYASSQSLPYGAHLPNRQYQACYSQLPEMYDPNYYPSWEEIFPGHDDVNFPEWPSATVTGLVSGSSYYDGPIIADDWVADKDQPILGLRWWGIFDDWTEQTVPSSAPAAFHIAIWSDNCLESLPDTMLWETMVTSPAISYSGDLVRTYIVSDGPDRDDYTDGSACFEYAIVLSQEDWFTPPEDGTYWLSISAAYLTQPDHPWRNLLFYDDQNAKRIFNNTSSWPPTLGYQANYQGMDTSGWGNSVDSFPLSYELISSRKVNFNGELYDGWLGDFNQDGQTDQQDLDDLIKVFIF